MSEQSENLMARRAFLARLTEWGTAGVAAFVALPTGSVVGAPSLAVVDAGAVTQAHFAGLVGATFHVQPPSGKPADLTLVETRALPSGFGKAKPPPGVTRRPAFAVVFRSAKPLVLPSATYVLTNDQLGSISLLLSPVGQPQKGYFEAVFG